MLISTIQRQYEALWVLFTACRLSYQKILQAILKKAGVSTYAAHLGATISYEGADYKKPCAFMIGNEANGLSDEVAALADCKILIPMAGQVESLNAAMAATVLMFEAARQRRN